MGLAIEAPDRGPIPRHSVLTLRCDVHPGDFFSAPREQTFTRGYFTDQYSDAMQAGWKEVFRSDRLSSALNAAASREMELYDSLHRRSKEALDNMPVDIALGSLPATVMFWGRKAPKRFVGWIEKKLQDRDDARTLYGRAGLDPHRCAGLMRSRVDYAAIVPRRQIPISLKKERLS